MAEGCIRTWTDGRRKLWASNESAYAIFAHAVCLIVQLDGGTPRLLAQSLKQAPPSSPAPAADSPAQVISTLFIPNVRSSCRLIAPGIDSKKDGQPHADTKRCLLVYKGVSQPAQS